eukprot:scaffold170964_cov126-Cyclotella_meneghiniana.AAC.3
MALNYDETAVFVSDRHNICRLDLDCKFNSRSSFTLSNTLTSSSIIFKAASDDEEEKKDGDEKAASLPVRGLTRMNSRISLASCESVTNLSDTEICSDTGAKVYFERSGPRKWNMPPFEYANSSVPDAIACILDHL